MANLIYDNKTDRTYETETNKSLKFLYNNKLGLFLLNTLIKRKFVSNFGSLYMKSFLSKPKIKKFIKENNIDMSLYEPKKYKSFNDFFIRKINLANRPIAKDKNAFISPADSKLQIFNIDDKLKLLIKNNTYTLNELIQDDKLAMQYKGGTCLVFRLTVDDYHRYSFIDDGVMINQKEIKGVYHTVSEASHRYNIYHDNHRIVNALKTANFDSIIQIEVGALMVGKIINHPLKKFKKGDEKGYFCFGGSTIVIILKKDLVKFNDYIINASLNNIETKVLYGERIGTKIVK